MYTTRFLDVPPLDSVAGTVRLPGSKSISNRVLLLAGLCEGETVIDGLLASDDTEVMLQALAALGCTVERSGEAVCIRGIGGELPVREADLFLGNAGTAMRPLTAALAVLAAVHGGAFRLHGVARMHERPIGDLVDALRAIGCRIDYEAAPGYPPLRIGAAPSGLHALDAIRVRGDVSSQFLTALLLALPLATAGGSSARISVDGELISKPYVGMTLQLLERFGIAVERDGWQRFTIPANSQYRSPRTLRVEGDASSASYFIGAAAIAAGGQPLRIEGVGLDSMQGDIRFVDAARAMGAQVDGGAGWLEVRRGTLPLRPIDLDCKHLPDAAMTLAVLALFAEGTSRLTGIASWRVKETDRIAAMATELRRIGAAVETTDDSIAITPPAEWRAGAIKTYDDHRVAMCFALAAFSRCAGAAPALPVRILDPRCVGKTFPDFFEALFGVAAARPDDIPVLTIDGPTASGKGTLASAVAARLGYHLLDSGAVYRAAALAASRAGVDRDDEPALADLAARLDLRFGADGVWLGGDEVGESLRLEAIGSLASRISAWPRVRRALLDIQLAFHRLPGLVADGRDMGTVVFPVARLKVFLTASAAQRAERRYRQLISRGISANIDSLRADLEARDARDQSRSVSPSRPAPDALLLDNSALSIEDSVEQVLAAWQARTPFG
ncbi:bifunctional 3-phosphoshikimate 1-carboxyvinyltransferase/cytidylate kinase [Piscinibacter koreensis]|uniref:Multifunctional fusion protein n=1 Tax=Piscinibacter koreensis TaxID=2742824 RepID=A0A7Y6TXE9_9BURK|nr:bifunctional 3-phosphoshikimate 1-carboxyvinyltransferase/cytidylate kinase [Schlegelella koreensis]NUZ07098.1 bifunctional 3-phosphoshikimate 1-carboxyvinyltransferase/cytidylate kinase [Schlegelella koreensis]